MMDGAENHNLKRLITLPRSAVIVFGVLGLFLGIFVAHALHLRKVLPENSVAQVSNVIRLDTQTSKFILKNGIPFLEKMVDEDDPLTFLEIDWIDMYWHLAANTKNTSPLEIVRSQLPILAVVKVEPKLTPPRHPIPIQNLPPDNPPTLLSTGENPIISHAPVSDNDPAVFVYHTHTSESYIPVSGKDHLLNQQGDVVKAGSYLQQILEEKYHLKCVHSDTIHDQFPFRDSYKRSQVTVINYLKKHPGTGVVIDLHRDATPGLPNSRVIKGVKCATIVTVVGSDKMGLPHPHWKENLEFAKKLNENMDLFYPGLSNGIIISDARYNQHLHTHAILVEFGDQYTGLEEVYHSLDLFAEILALTLNKESSPGITTLDN